MRTLSAALLAEVGATVRRPGYLIQIGFSSPLRLSTLGDVSFDGHVWAQANVKVRGMSETERADQGGSLTLANTWGDYGALVLAEGVSGRDVLIYVCYAGAPGAALLKFSGAGGEASSADNGDITITLTSSGSRPQRRRINAASGFRHLIPAGTRLTIGGTAYILERR